MLLCLIHWTKTLGSPRAKESAGHVFDFLLSKTMGMTEIWPVYLRDDQLCGELSVTGLRVSFQNGKLLDATDLAESYPLIKSALGRISLIFI